MCPVVPTPRNLLKKCPLKEAGFRRVKIKCGLGCAV